MRKTVLYRSLAPVVLALSSGSVSAAGFQLLEQNASGLGNAYAGSAAVAENASTVFYNPAGMTRLAAREASVGLSLIRPSFKFKDQGSSAGALTGGSSDAGSWAALPNAYFTWALNDDLRLGLGIGAPFGLMTDYQRNWLGSAHSIEFDIKTVNLNPALAWRVNEQLSLGFGLNWQRMDAEYLRRAGTMNLPPAAGSLPLASTLVKLKADDDSWGWNAGVLLQLSEATRLGLSYRSKIKHQLRGDLKASGPVAAFNAAVSSKAGATVELPDTFILSLAHALDSRWELLADVSWTGWSSIKRVDIKRRSGAQAGQTAQVLDTDFRDSWRLALGANYRLDPAWKLKFGLAHDQTPVKNARKRLTSLPDNDRLWFSFGAQWQPAAGNTLDLGVAYLYVRDTSINAGDAADPQRGLVKGEYDSSVWIVGAQYSLAF